MKNIVDIYEKLSIDNIRISDDFPIEDSFDNIVSFLKAHGFSKYQNVGQTFDEKKEKFEAGHGKAIIISMSVLINGYYIRFADTSNKRISKKNPVFLIEFKNNEKNFFIEYNTWKEEHISEREFLNILNKTILF